MVIHFGNNLSYDSELASLGTSLGVASQYQLWWDAKAPQQRSLFQSSVTLGEGFYKEIIERPIPINVEALKVLKKSPGLPPFRATPAIGGRDERDTPTRPKRRPRQVLTRPLPEPVPQGCSLAGPRPAPNHRRCRPRARRERADPWQLGSPGMHRAR